MVLNVAQARELNSPETRASITHATTAIDRAIRDKYQNGVVSSVDLGKMSGIAVQEVKRLYEEAGWRVNIQTCDRTPAPIQFSI
jgi:hypothetical protein